MNTSAIVLAAGHGKRMGTALPKVLHQIGGKPLIKRVLDSLATLVVKQTIVVLGYQKELLQQSLTEYAEKIQLIQQEQQGGTGHAVQAAWSQIDADTDQILVLNGDVPLIKAKTLQELLRNTPKNSIGMLTAEVTDPTGSGRICRDPTTNKLVGIIEEKDATTQQKAIKEINSGIYLFPRQFLERYLFQLRPNNAQQELYITDLIAMGISAGLNIYTQPVTHTMEVQGINTLIDLARLERVYQQFQAEQYMLKGVGIVDPQRFEVRGNPDEINIAAGTIIDINVILEGKIAIGANVNIGANVWIKNSQVAAETTVLPYSMIDGAKIGESCQIGPFARIRPNTEIKALAKVGNFVEIKQTIVGEKSRINHLSYIGDTEIGKNVNIGAGSITCNYDGVNKYKTIIADDVLVGSDTQLIAPVTVGGGATIAAGTTITKDVPAGKLVLNYKQLKVIDNWQRPQKREREK